MFTHNIAVLQILKTPRQCSTAQTPDMCGYTRGDCIMYLWGDSMKDQVKDTNSHFVSIYHNLDGVVTCIYPLLIVRSTGPVSRKPIWGRNHKREEYRHYPLLTLDMWPRRVTNIFSINNHAWIDFWYRRQSTQNNCLVEIYLNYFEVTQVSIKDVQMTTLREASPPSPAPTRLPPRPARD